MIYVDRTLRMEEVKPTKHTPAVPAFQSNCGSYRSYTH